MPGYGVLPAGEGTGLLPWSWAEARLTDSHDYWLATVWPDGRPHVMPVWGVWLDGALWFSSSPGSRKTRNLRADPRCTITTDNAYEPVVVEGRAALVTGRVAIEPFAHACIAKYGGDLTVEFYAENATFRVQPSTAFSLTEADFTGSPTRWRFDG
jgi:PPOX class probable F420-dependent enzyme